VAADHDVWEVAALAQVDDVLACGAKHGGCFSRGEPLFNDLRSHHAS
jgi:hypothetical protein